MFYLRALLCLCIIISGVGAHKGDPDDERPVTISFKSEWLKTVDEFIERSETATDPNEKKRYARLAVICFVSSSDDFQSRIVALSWLPRRDKFRIKTLSDWFNNGLITDYYQIFALSLLPQKHPLRVKGLENSLTGFSPTYSNMDKMVAAASLLPRQHMRRIEVLSAIAGDSQQEEEYRLDAAMGLSMDSGVRAAALKDLYVHNQKMRSVLQNRIKSMEEWTELMLSVALDNTLDFETREHAADMFIPGTGNHKKCYESLLGASDIDDEKRAYIRGILDCYS